MEKVRSLVEEAWADPKHSVGMAAAELAMKVDNLLNRAFDSRPDISYVDIATRLNVSEERVKTILSHLNSDLNPDEDDAKNSCGNLMVASIAKTLWALGYKLEIKVIAVDADADAARYVNDRPRRRRRPEPENLTYEI